MIHSAVKKLMAVDYYTDIILRTNVSQGANFTHLRLASRLEKPMLILWVLMASSSVNFTFHVSNFTRFQH
jgi:hypothetical protein